jgi:ABC-2 type transport system permease protein
MNLTRKDWLEFVRDRRLVALAGLALLIALAALANSYARVTSHESNRAAAVAQDIETWNNQGTRNPHGAAHFGEWAMRPLTPMALLEPGVTPYAGSAVWLEAHLWNAARSRPIEDQDSAFDIGPFSVAWVLQVVVPLIIFVLAAGLVSRERERGTLRLVLASGLPARRLVLGKAGSIARIAGLLALPILIAAIAAVILAGPADPARLALWCLAYLVYLLIVAAIALAVSALAWTSAQAMLVLACLWLVGVVLMPRVGATLATAAAPVPSADAFWAAIQHDRRQQPNVFGEGAARFTDDVMRRYGVSRREDLPVSLGGLQLEEDERIGNVVFDRHYGRLADSYADQRTMLRWVSLLSPLPAIQNLSMSLAGTSMPDQIDFQRQGEAHRRLRITFLNADMTKNAGAKEFQYRASEALWQQTPRFAYQPSTIGTSLRSTAVDALILFAWLAAALALLFFAARRVGREAL